jgi:hypothetical protein
MMHIILCNNIQKLTLNWCSGGPETSSFGACWLANIRWISCYHCLSSTAPRNYSHENKNRLKLDDRRIKIRH